MSALRLILAMTQYAYNDASIIGGSLTVMHSPQKNHHVEQIHQKKHYSMHLQCKHNMYYCTHPHASNV